MMNAGMAMVRNLVPLDIMIYGVEVGGDAWTRWQYERHVGIAWQLMFHLFPLVVGPVTLLSAYTSNFNQPQPHSIIPPGIN